MNLIEPIPIDSDDRADKIALTKVIFGDTPKGRRIVDGLRRPRRGGRANDAAGREQQQMEKLSKFYKEQGRGPNQAA